MQNISWRNLQRSNLKKARDKKFAPQVYVSSLQYIIDTEDESRASEMRTPTNLRTDPLKMKLSHSAEMLVSVLLKKSVPKIQNVFEGNSFSVPAANGSIRSIRLWAREGLGGDRMQARAFEVLICSFLLTFLKDVTDNDEVLTDDAARTIGVLRRMKNALRTLKGGVNEQLVCLLHGPGGSGKSTVINMVQAYAKSYCEELCHPYTSRTIIVTAMSGVAATLLHGETCHSVFGLNWKSLTEEEKDLMADTRLVIVDEVSFASDKVTEIMQLRFCEAFRELYGSMADRMWFLSVTILN